MLRELWEMFYISVDDTIDDDDDDDGSGYNWNHTWILLNKTMGLHYCQTCTPKLVSMDGSMPSKWLKFTLLVDQYLTIYM